MWMPFAGRIIGAARVTIQRPNAVAPYPAGVDHDAGTHCKRHAVGNDGRASDTARDIVRERLHRRVVGDGGAVEGGGASDRQGQPGVVGRCVEVHVCVRESRSVERRETGQGFGFRQSLVQPAVAKAAGEVVAPHREAQATSELPVDEATIVKDG